MASRMDDVISLACETVRSVAGARRVPHHPHSVPNSGSFIRPTAAGLSFGVTFLQALTSKYIEIPRGSTSLEKVILGSSGGAIEVEAVGLDKIRNKLAQLERLREVSLDNECVSRADPPGEIGRTCPGTSIVPSSISNLPRSVCLTNPSPRRIVEGRRTHACSYCSLIISLCHLDTEWSGIGLEPAAL